MEKRSASPESRNAALMELHAALGRLQSEGATDVEPPFIQDLINRVNSNEIDPSEALKRMHSMLSARGDYH